MNQEPNFVSGVEPEIINPDDQTVEAVYAAQSVFGEVPSTLDLRNNLPEVRNQGSRGTCAAFTASAIKEWQEKTDSGYEGNMSPEFVYFHRSNKPNSGMYSSDVMNILVNNGCCPENELEYQSDDDNAPEMLSNTILESALKYKSKEYARIDTIDGLKTALYQSGPCYISFPVYDVRPEFWRKSAPDVDRRGGHAVTVVGYNKKGFILRNSWGKGWNDDGHVIYPYEDFGSHWTCFTVIDTRGSPKPPYSKKNSCCNLM